MYQPNFFGRFNNLFQSFHIANYILLLSISVLIRLSLLIISIAIVCLVALSLDFIIQDLALPVQKRFFNLI